MQGGPGANPSRGGGDAAVAAAAAAASVGIVPPMSVSPSLSGFVQQQAPPAPQLQLPLGLPGLGLQQPLMQLPPMAHGGGGSCDGGRSSYFTLPFMQPQGAPGEDAGSGGGHQFTLPIPGGMGAMGNLSLGWPMGGGSGAAGPPPQLPPASSSILTPMTGLPQQLLMRGDEWRGELYPHQAAAAAAHAAAQQAAQQAQQAAQQVQQVQQALNLQQALSAPQIMSNTDHNGSTEGTQAWNGGGGGGGGGGRRGSARGAAPLEGDESAAAESRLRGAPPSSRRNLPSDHRKSRYRGVQWDRNGSKWRARIHTDKTRHIGYFEKEEDAGRAWDMAALKYFGKTTDILSKLNFQSSLEAFRQQAAAQAAPTGQQSSEAAGGGAPGSAGPSSTTAGGCGGAQPQFRGVAKTQDGMFKVTVTVKRVPHVVGVFATAEEAARVYDRENLRINGRGAITNFSLSDYLQEDVRGQCSPIPPLPRCYSASGDQFFGGAPSGSQAQGAPGPGQRAGSVPPSGAPSALLHTPALLAQPSPKRCRMEEESLVLPHLPGGAQHLRAHQAAVAAGAFYSPPDAVGSRNDESAGFSGVLHVPGTGGDEWQAYLSIDLGKFRTAEAAARAHDTAKLLAGGLQAPTNFPLADAFATRLAAYKQPAPAAQQPLHHPQQPQYRGVVLRNGSWLALLDIAGSPYELGPYPSELAAAQAYDRYCLLLHGVRAQINFPPWYYLACHAECMALLEAVAQVQQQQQQAGSGTPQGAKVPTPPSADRTEPPQQQPAQQQQQQQQQAQQQALQQGLPTQAVDPASLQQQQQQQQQRMMLLQQMELAGAQVQAQQAQQAQQPALHQATDLGTQLARISSMHAVPTGSGFAAGGGAAVPGAAANAAAPAAAWQPAASHPDGNIGMM